jgi:predicted lipoprotein with Yx(FWY)xxD motif
MTLVIALSTSAHAQGPGQLKVQIAEKQPYGKYLADATGRAFYMFTADSRGVSNCYSPCTQAWPPLKPSSMPETGPDVTRSMLGTIQRSDGSAQITYNGMPLYYFVGDQHPGSTAGEGMKAQGGEWYLVSPTGEKIDED